jgi:hypothetical protein
MNRRSFVRVLAYLALLGLACFFPAAAQGAAVDAKKALKKHKKRKKRRKKKKRKKAKGKTTPMTK